MKHLLKTLAVAVAAIAIGACAPKPKSISILAIGNSFSIDAMEYLYGILEQAGYDDITLGNLYIGGCSLERHATNLAEDKPAYQYFSNTTGTWEEQPQFKAGDALKSRKWDFVSMQQASGYSGLPESYQPFLQAVVDSVKIMAPEAKRMWHMTWAYEGTSNHPHFPFYGNDQLQMYYAIASTVQSTVLADSADFDLVLPVGTALQNLRGSFIGDHLTRDGYHLDLGIGRWTAAYTWATAITGCAPDLISLPAEIGDAQTEAAIKKAVADALTHPFEVTSK